MLRCTESVTRRAVAGALALALAACGGGSPTGPGPAPSPSPTGSTVVAVVFYDENGNGRLETDEAVRVPDVEVSIGGRSARTERLTGRAVVTGVPDGTQAASLRSETLPPFFRAGTPVTTPVPPLPDATLLIPLTLPLSDLARPNVYMAFGDSITRGDGSAQGGYPPMLESLLRAHFAGAQVVNHGRDSTNSFEGRDRIRRNLRLSLPAYTLILYGTNDWHAPECQSDPQPPRCPTVENLRLIVEEVKDFGSLPFLALLPPVNPALNPEGRNQWNRDLNALLRNMATQEGAFVVDLNQAFTRQGDLPRLFSDHVHPSDAGYRVMAESFFEAIAHGGSPSAITGAFRGP